MKKHTFDRVLVNELKKLTELDNYHGILMTIYDWSLIIGSIFLSECIFNRSSLKAFLLTFPVYIFAQVVISSRINSLYEIFHASAHRTAADNKYLNIALGTLFSGWPILFTWTAYLHSHVQLHHNYLGDFKKDPDNDGIISAGLYRKSVRSQDVKKFLLTIPSPLRSIKYFKYLLQINILPSYELISERILRGLYWSVLILFCWYYESLYLLTLYWVIPYLTISLWIGDLLELTEHYPLLKLYDLDIKMTWNRKLYRIESFFFGNHNEQFHLVHHLWPRIPNWNLAKAHEIMMKDEEYSKISNNVPLGLFNLIKHIYKLVDMNKELFYDNQ